MQVQRAPSIVISIALNASLKVKFWKGSLVAGASTAEQAADALGKLRAAGWNPESDTLHNAHYGFGNAVIISMMYANAYGRFNRYCLEIGYGIRRPTRSKLIARSFFNLFSYRHFRINDIALRTIFSTASKRRFAPQSVCCLSSSSIWSPQRITGLSAVMGS